MLQQYFFTSYAGEWELAKELGTYVARNQINAADASRLLPWIEERGIQEFRIARGGWLLFDASYTYFDTYFKKPAKPAAGTTSHSDMEPGALAESRYSGELGTAAEPRYSGELGTAVEPRYSGEPGVLFYPGRLPPGARKMPESEWRPYYPVAFADGPADVYISTGFDVAYYRLLLAGSVIAGFAACLWVLISGMQENVLYIRLLQREVDAIKCGNLQNTVSASGKDELGQLARGLDQMRRQLYEKEQTEKELRDAQEKLVLGMSHDLRTPLTGLLAYMEVLKKQGRHGVPDCVYIDKAYDKILQIKHLSDQMFEYFLIASQRGAQLEPPEELYSAFGDYLSEMCAMLACSGFCTDAGMLEWRPGLVQVNPDYLGRIVNNIYSNLEKYADRKYAIVLRMVYEPGRAGIAVQNRMAMPGRYVEGTGIGVQNISRMMEQMGGSVHVGMTEEDYQIVLYFPLL